MNMKVLLSTSLIILCALDVANAYTNLEMSRPVDINTKNNMVSINNVKENKDIDNMSVASYSTANSDASIVRETKNALKNLKTDLATTSIGDLKKNLTGKTITVNPDSIKIDNPNSFSIKASKPTNNNTENKTPIQLMKEWRNNYKLKISHPNSFSFNKYKKENANSFSIIGKKNNIKNKYSKWDDLKIDDNKKAFEFKDKISQLNIDDKKELLNNLSETLTSNEVNLPSNFKIKDKSIAQYFGAGSPGNPQDPNQQLADIFYALTKFKVFSVVMSSIYNPFLIDMIISDVFTPVFTLPIEPNTVMIKKKETPNTKEELMIAKISTPAISSFSSVKTTSSIVPGIPSVSSICSMSPRVSMFDTMFSNIPNFMPAFSSSLLFNSWF